MMGIHRLMQGTFLVCSRARKQPKTLAPRSLLNKPTICSGEYSLYASAMFNATAAFGLLLD